MGSLARYAYREAKARRRGTHLRKRMNHLYIPSSVERFKITSLARYAFEIDSSREEPVFHESD